jgi:membrane fusion protein (multidrug efflux system)
MSKLHPYFIIVFLMSFLASNAVAQKRNGPTEVIVSPVVRDAFADKIEALGTTKANESVVVTADRSEKIAAIHFEDGQKVKQGDLLVTLDKAQEEAELRASKALTAETQNSYNRAQGLSGNSALPKAILQERAAELKQSQAATEALEARLSSYEITAPFDGILGLREVSVGTLVQPGDVITTIDDLSQVKVDFDVPSVFLSSLKPGLPIVGRVEAFGDRAFKGRVSTVNTRIDTITRTVKVRAVIPNEDGRLKPGLLMSIELSNDLRQALLIPEEAVVKRGQDNFVFVVTKKEDKFLARQHRIQLGARKPGTVEVLSGVGVGDKIVNHGTLKIRDGAEVSIRAEEAEDTPLDVLLKQESQAKSQG